AEALADTFNGKLDVSGGAGVGAQWPHFRRVHVVPPRRSAEDAARPSRHPAESHVPNGVRLPGAATDALHPPSLSPPTLLCVYDGSDIRTAQPLAGRVRPLLTAQSS